MGNLYECLENKKTCYIEKYKKAYLAFAGGVIDKSPRPSVERERGYLLALSFVLIDVFGLTDKEIRAIEEELCATSNFGEEMDSFSRYHKYREIQNKIEAY